MPLVPAKCPNCGATLSVDANGKAEICQYCGSAFIVEEAKQIFNNTYNVTNNISAGTLVFEQGDPQYQSVLQRIKAAVNHNKNTVKSSYLMGSKEFSQYVDLYFDKEEFLYNYAILLYYDAVKCDFIFRNDNLVKEFERIFNSVASLERKATLKTYLSEIKEKYADENTIKEKYKNNFINDLENNKSSFDGLTVQEHVHNNLYVFVFYDDKLYLIPLGKLEDLNTMAGNICIISNVSELIGMIYYVGYKKNGWLNFKKARSFTFEAREVGPDDHSGSVDISNEKISFPHELSRQYIMGSIRNQPSSGVVRMANLSPLHEWKFKGSYEDNKDKFIEIIRYTTGRCVKCGGPLRDASGLFTSGLQCCYNCGFSLKDTRIHRVCYTEFKYT